MNVKRCHVIREHGSASMNSDAGGWLWLLIDVGFVVILAITLVYGIYM
jgi:hypothetical protein